MLYRSGVRPFCESDDQFVSGHASEQHRIDAAGGRSHTPEAHAGKRERCHNPRQHLQPRSPHKRDDAAQAEILEMSMHVRVQSNRLARNGSVISVKSRLFLTNPASEFSRLADLCLLVKSEDA